MALLFGSVIFFYYICPMNELYKQAKSMFPNLNLIKGNLKTELRVNGQLLIDTTGNPELIITPYLAGLIMGYKIAK
mgnify:CR=1 FL=1